MSGRPKNEDRQNALELGLPTYQGTVHAKCGTTERYTVSCGCVHCGRAKATAQREALRTLEAQEAINQATAAMDAAIDVTAETRYRDAIEDLM